MLVIWKHQDIQTQISHLKFPSLFKKKIHLENVRNIHVTVTLTAKGSIRTGKTGGLIRSMAA